MFEFLFLVIFYLFINSFYVSYLGYAMYLLAMWMLSACKGMQTLILLFASPARICRIKIILNSKLFSGLN